MFASPDFCLFIAVANMIFLDDGVSAQALVTDRCAGCAGWGDLDMSTSLFEVFAPQSVGRLYGVDWDFN